MLRRTAGVLASFLLAAGCLSGSDVARPRPPPAAPAPDASLAPPPHPSGRLPATVKPRRYGVSLAIDPEKDRFTGDVTIAVELQAPARAIVLHGRDLTISRAEVSTDGDSFPAAASFRLPAGGKEAPDELVLAFARPVPAGRAEIHIAYSAPLGDKLVGLYRVKEGASYYAFTQFEPADARRMMPCFDEPGVKVPFDLKVTTPKGNIVVANAEEVERTPAEEGRSTTFRFAPTQPLPTYLMALAVGPFDVREGAASPVKIRLITAKGKTALGDLALEAAVAHTRLLGEYFDRPYPYPKLDLVAAPEFGFGAMENAGLILFREELLLLDAKSASAESRRFMALTVAHEIAHHWFGNLVTMPWWDDLWLNEGFATWMESKIVDTWRPAMGTRLEALRSKATVMGLDALDAARAVRQPVATTSEAEEAFDGITYDKGAAVLGMLESWLGPTVFRDGVRAYVKGHENGTATSADLFNALHAASGKDVWHVASGFLDRPGVPLVRAELRCEGGVPRVALTQERYRASPSAAPGEAPWTIPICIGYEGADRGAPACGLLESGASEIALPVKRCPKWIYPNAAENGYYLFALPPAQASALAKAVRSLDVSSRIGLVNNAWALVRSGDMKADALFDLLDALAHEKHPLVIDQVLATLEEMNTALVDDASRPAFRRYVSSLLLPTAKELGWEAKRGDGDDQKLLRKHVLGALAVLGQDAWVSAEAEKRATAFLVNPRSVDADIAGLALRAASRRAGEKRFNELLEASKRAASPEDHRVVIAALASFADPALLRRALDTVLTSQVRMQDSRDVLHTATLWSESRPLVLAWTKEHFPELKAKLPDFLVVRFTGLVETICDKPARADAATFFGEALKGVEGADRALHQALETASLCIDLRGREGEAVKRRLGGRGR